MQKEYKNEFTKLLNCKYPIIAGPMFLVSNVPLVVSVSQSGAIGGVPSLNWRKSADFHQALKEIDSQTKEPYAVNLIVNKSNPRQNSDLDICAEQKVPLVITSLGNPKKVIEVMHSVGGKVFCDVTNLEYAKKVQDLGADGVIAVSAGAGGHAGATSPLVLIPQLASEIDIPVVAAGGVATGEQIASLLMLGASAVQIGTRFIASEETKVGQGYKDAIIDATPDDILMTSKISGVPVSVIRTEYIDKIGLDVNPIEKFLHKNPKTKKYMKMFRSLKGMKMLSDAVGAPTWKQVWSAGQGVAFIEKVLPASEIVDRLMKEFYQAGEKAKSLFPDSA